MLKLRMQVKHKITDIGVARIYDAIVVAVEEVHMLLQHRAVVGATYANNTVSACCELPAAVQHSAL
jgi:hypothetical protein